MLQTCYKAWFPTAQNRRMRARNCQQAHVTVRELDPSRSPDDFPGVHSKELPICHPG